MVDGKTYTVGLSLDKFVLLLQKITIDTLNASFYYENDIIRIMCGATTCLELKLVASEHETQFMVTHNSEDCNFALSELGAHLQNKLNEMSITISSKK